MKLEPKGKPGPVVKPGEFVFAASHLDHGHINGQCQGLIEAGGELRYVYDTDPKRLADFCAKFPQAKPVDSFDRLLENPEIRLIANAAVPSDRGPLGCRALRAGKDYFVDKAPFTSLEQLADARKAASDTGRKYMVYYAERLHSESAIFAGDLIEQGVIGKVLQIIGFGPHRLNAPNRPAWFFEMAKYGGIICDIGSHMCEQALFYSGGKDAKIAHSAVANYTCPEYPELQDFGEVSMIMDNGVSAYFRVDWLTPKGQTSWGDGRMFFLGSKGTIELRKNLDVARDPSGSHLYLVNDDGEQHIPVQGKVGFPFFGQLILDCLNRTETAMTQAHAFKAAELSLQAQKAAIKLA